VAVSEIRSRLRWRANHSRGAIAVGGKLQLTGSELVFVPNALERLLRRREWWCDLESITFVGVAARETHPFNGALRRRLAVAHDDVEDFFVVDDAERVAEAIKERLPET
jgi:hypothetical protein